MSAYLDASCLIPLFLPDHHGPAMVRWLRENEERLYVSDFAAAEFASVVSRLTRMQQVAEQAAAAILGRFDIWRAMTPFARLTNASDIAACDHLIRDFSLKLLVPDALHLAMSMADRAMLVTFDQRLAEAARQLKYPVVVPQA